MNHDRSTPLSEPASEPAPRQSRLRSRQEMTRRAFIKRAVWSGAGVLGAGGAFHWANKIEPNWMDIRRITIPMAQLSPAFNGLTIAQVSDIHASSWMTLPRLQNVIQQVNALNADIIALTGDFVSRRQEEHQYILAEALGNLRAKIDVFAVMGNHDHWENIKYVRQTLAKSGAQELRNSFHSIRRDGQTLHLCGVDDAWAGAADIDGVLRKLPAQGAAILMAHEPDFADDYVKAHRFDLQISGHTHGGQVRIPGVGPMILPSYGQKYHTGLYRIGSTPFAKNPAYRALDLYVNRGVGMVRPYLRFDCRPEITLFTLRAVV